MTNLSLQEVYNLIETLLKEFGLSGLRKIWVLSDVYSEDLIEKWNYKNTFKILISLKIEKETYSFSIDTIDIEDFKKQFNKVIATEVKFL